MGPFSHLMILLSLPPQKKTPPKKTPKEKQPKTQSQTIQWGRFVYLPTTLPETNIAPASKLPQKETHLPTIHFQVRTVSFRERKLPNKS